MGSGIGSDMIEHQPPTNTTEGETNASHRSADGCPEPSVEDSVNKLKSALAAALEREKALSGLLAKMRRYVHPQWHMEIDAALSERVPLAAQGGSRDIRHPSEKLDSAPKGAP